MAYRGLYQLLLEALQDPRPGMAPDDPAEIARRYPKNGGLLDPHLETGTRASPTVGMPSNDPNFRQLSRAKPVSQGQTADRPSASNAPDYLWAPSDEESAAENGVGSQPPWWTPLPPPTLPVLGGRFALSRAGALGRSIPFPWSKTPPKIPMPEIPEAWKKFGPLLMMYPELLRQRLLDEGDESEVGNTAASPILELYQKRRRSKSGPASIRNAPGIVPDAPGDASLTDDDDFCARRFKKELNRCWTKYPKKYGGCRERAVGRWIGCDRNGGVPPADELDEWGDYD